MKTKTTMAAIALVGLLALASAVNSLTFDADDAETRPVTKVVTLLKEMLSQLEKEDEDDDDIYDKLEWCTTHDKEKTASITAAEDKIASLASTIEGLSASSARLNTEINNLKTEVAANKDALDKATTLREKELAEFNAEQKDALESIAALRAAIAVIGQHNSSLLQMPHSNLMGVVASVQHVMQMHKSTLAGVLTHSERRAVASFVQAPQDYFDAAPPFTYSYAPRSGEIFGILKQMMKGLFEVKLSASQKEELKSQKEYEDLKAAKEGQIAAGQNQIDKKSSELADTDAKMAEAEEDRDDTKTSLAADEQFLLTLKEKCAATDAEWDERQKTWQQEMEAVSKSIANLSADDAQDVFRKNLSVLAERGAVAEPTVAATVSDGKDNPIKEDLDDIVHDMVKKEINKKKKKEIKKKVKKQVSKKLGKVKDQIKSLEKKLKKAQKKKKALDKEKNRVKWQGCKEHMQEDYCTKYCDRSTWFRPNGFDHYTCRTCLDQKIQCFEYGSFVKNANYYCSVSCTKKNMQRKKIDACFSCLEGEVHKKQLAEKDKMIEACTRQLKKAKREIKRLKKAQKGTKEENDKLRGAFKKLVE